MVDKREEILDALDKKTDDEIRKEFYDFIVFMDDDDFWKYIREWKDASFLIEEMRDWSIETKRVELKHLKKRFVIDKNKE
jgi:hypothetical protein